MTPETPFTIPDGLTFDDLTAAFDQAVIDRIRLATNGHDASDWADGAAQRAELDHAAGHMDDATYRSWQALTFLVPLDDRHFAWLATEATARAHLVGAPQ